MTRCSPGFLPEVAEALLRTSVLDTLTGPLCDALLERSGSAAILVDLAAPGVLRAAYRADTRSRTSGSIAGAAHGACAGLPGTWRPSSTVRASAWHRGERDADRARHRPRRR